MNLENPSNEEIRQRLVERDEKWVPSIENAEEVTKNVDQEIIRHIEESIPHELEQIEEMKEVAGCLSCGGYICGGTLVSLKPKKSPESYDRQMKKAIKLIINKNNKAEVFGSFVYKASFYPGDVDLQEVIDACCDKKNVFKKLAGVLKKLVKRLAGKKGYYFSEIKAGIDHRFNLDTKSPEFMEQVCELRKQNLIPEGVFKLIDTLHESQDSDDHDLLEEQIRLLKVLRWDVDEILQGYKILKGGEKKTLLQAVSDKSPVKIDIWAPIQGRYIEVTNFFLPVIYNKELDTLEFPTAENTQFLSPDRFDYVQSMKDQIIKLTSKTFWNPFKMSKRIFGLSRAINDTESLRLVAPLLQSNVARLYQINSDIDLMTMMMEKLGKRIPRAYIGNELDNLKNRLAYIYDINLDDMDIYKKIDKIVDEKYSLTESIDVLKKMKKYFKELINEATMEYLKSHSLWPVPQRLMTAPSLAIPPQQIFSHLVRGQPKGDYKSQEQSSLEAQGGRVAPIVKRIVSHLDTHSIPEMIRIVG